MKRTKKQKGITLVALIITIIVLLILAVVAIRAVQGEKIIAHAKNARAQYEEKTVEENELLLNLAGYITGNLNEEILEETPELPPRVKSVLTIQGDVSKTNITYEIGMTWHEWVNSEYNTEGFVENEDGTIDSGSKNKMPSTPGTELVTSDMPIMGNYLYYMGFRKLEYSKTEIKECYLYYDGKKDNRSSLALSVLIRRQYNMGRNNIYYS